MHTQSDTHTYSEAPVYEKTQRARKWLIFRVAKQKKEERRIAWDNRNAPFRGDEKDYLREKHTKIETLY